MIVTGAVEERDDVVVVRPVDGIVKLLGAALVAAVLLLVFVVWRQGNSLDDFTAQQRRSDEVATCVRRATSAVEAVDNAKRIEADFADAAIKDALRIVGEGGEPTPERLGRLRVAVGEAANRSERVRRFNDRLPQLYDLRSASADGCAHDANWRIPADLTSTTP